jgi:hypothetical protein
MSEGREARLKRWADDHERDFRLEWNRQFEPRLQMFPNSGPGGRGATSPLGGQAVSAEAKPR